MAFSFVDKCLIASNPKTIEYQVMELRAFSGLSFLYLFTWLLCLPLRKLLSHFAPEIFTSAPGWVSIIVYMALPLFLLFASYVVVVVQVDYNSFSKWKRFLRLCLAMLLFAATISFFSHALYDLCPPEYFLVLSITSFLYFLITFVKPVLSRAGFYVVFSVLYILICIASILITHRYWVYILFYFMMGGFMIYAIGNSMEGLKQLVLKTPYFKAENVKERFSIFLYLESLASIGLFIVENI